MYLIYDFLKRNYRCKLPVELLLYNHEELARNTFYEHCSDNLYIERPVKVKKIRLHNKKLLFKEIK